MKFLLLAIYIFSLGALASDPTHEHHVMKSINLKLNNGKKWSTDKPLRANMSAIHDHIKLNAPKIKNNNFTSDEYKKLGQEIDGNIQSIFKSCKLAPDADAQLHIIMAKMMSANSTLKGEAKYSKKHDAVHSILAAYKSYLKYFDHSGEK